MDPILLIGIIVLIGVIGSLLFKRTKVPEAIFLILLGLLIGPILHIVDPQPFVNIAPFFATIALVIILLDSGLSFNVFTLLKNFPKAILFSTSAIILTVILTTCFFHYIMHWVWLNALLISVITGGTTSITVSYLVSRLGVSKSLKDLLVIESVVSDVFLITAAIVVIEIIVSKTITLKSTASSLASSFSIALVIAVFLAIFWIYVLAKSKTKLSYVATVGFLFIMYAVVEYLKGSGAIAVLVFCIILGNSSKLIKRFHLKSTMLSVSTIKRIQTVQYAISFFTKTFFFVLLGIIFDIENLTSTLVLVGMGMLMVALVARYFSARVLIAFDRKFKGTAFLLTSILPRGFVATVLAFMPATFGIKIPYLVEIVLLMIFFTTITSIAAVALYEKGYMRPAEILENKGSNKNNAK